MSLEPNRPGLILQQASLTAARWVGGMVAFLISPRTGRNAERGFLCTAVCA